MTRERRVERNLGERLEEWVGQRKLAMIRKTGGFSVVASLSRRSSLSEQKDQSLGDMITKLLP